MGESYIELSCQNNKSCETVDGVNLQENTDTTVSLTLLTFNKEISLRSHMYYYYKYYSVKVIYLNVCIYRLSNHSQYFWITVTVCMCKYSHLGNRFGFPLFAIDACTHARIPQHINPIRSIDPHKDITIPGNCSRDLIQYNP